MSQDKEMTAKAIHMLKTSNMIQVKDSTIDSILRLVPGPEVEGKLVIEIRSQEGEIIGAASLEEVKERFHVGQYAFIS